MVLWLVWDFASDVSCSSCSFPCFLGASIRFRMQKCHQGVGHGWPPISLEVSLGFVERQGQDMSRHVKTVQISNDSQVIPK